MKRAGEYGIIPLLAVFNIAIWANHRAVESVVLLHMELRVQFRNQEKIHISLMISYPMTLYELSDMRKKHPAHCGNSVKFNPTTDEAEDFHVKIDVAACVFFS